MRIESSTVENHRFGVARRRGYDAAEVDAVMSRVADTLAQYEKMITRLEGRPSVSSASQGEITRTVVAAQENKNKLLSEARHAAAKIVDAAIEEAEAIRAEATMTADSITGAAEDHLTEAQVDAKRIREEAESHIDLAKARADEQRSRADTVLTSAIAEAEKLREQSEAAAVSQAAEAEQILHLAQAEANQLNAEAAQHADQARASTDADVADVLAGARQQAEAMINSAVEEARVLRERVQAEAAALRISKDHQADELISTARNEAAEIRAAASAAAEALTAQGRVSAEETITEARSQALDRLATAQLEAEELLTQASHESDSMLAVAREDSRRLEQRMARLRLAVTEFEAHASNLAEVAGDRAGLVSDMIDQELGPEAIKSPGETGAPPRAPRKKGKGRKMPKSPAPSGTEDPVALYAKPDGSGQLPVSRPTSTYSDPWEEETEGVTPRNELDLDEEQFVYDGGAVEPIEPDQAAVVEGGGGPATSTIYQRRGSGIKKRVAAIKIPDGGTGSA